MKLICDGLDLSDAVLKVSKALAVKTSNPVLEGIKISAYGDTLTLFATDMELTIEKRIKAEILMEGETVVVGKYFVELAKKLEKEQVELCKIDDGQLQIKYSDSVSELQVYPIENYPKIEKTDKGNSFSITRKEFKKLIERTAFSCSIDDSRPILKGCLFEIENNILTVVSLDGFRMSVDKKEVEASGNFKAVIPSRTLNEISKLLESDEEKVNVLLEKNTLYIEIDNTSLISRLIEGEFVKYNHILPVNFENTVVVNKNAFLNSIERAAIIAKNDRYNIVRLDIKEDSITVSAKSEIGSVNENVSSNLTGKDITIAFNGKYVMDFLKIIEEEFIYIKLNSPIDPCILSPVGDKDYSYLVLPVRINA